jgi:hypothetical protein
MAYVYNNFKKEKFYEQNVACKSETNGSFCPGSSHGSVFAAADLVREYGLGFAGYAERAG